MKLDTLKQIVLTSLFAFLQGSCGNPGDSFSEASTTSRTSVNGSISSQSGNQSDMAGWALALFEKDTQIARITEIDTAGQFTLSQLNPDISYTLALFSPSLILRAVLAEPDIDGLQVNQYFKLTSSNILPRLIHKGLVLNWQETTTIEMTEDAVADVDGDGIPEGVINALTSTETGLLLSSSDTDGDGITNLNDSDLDGDGMINLLDHNIDNDVDTLGHPLLNEFDSDSNGDLVRDTKQRKSRAYFSRVLQWATVQYEIVPTGVDNEYTRHITFLAQVDPAYLPGVKSLTIRRTPSLPLLDDATVSDSDDEGNVVLVPWDGRLLDDGQSEDGAYKDGLFARRVNLKLGSAPTSNQGVAFQVELDQWTDEFVYLFPPIKPVSPSPAYSSIDRTITFNTDESKRPFGLNTEFNWIVAIYEIQEGGTGKKIYTSRLVPGVETSLLLPDNVIEIGKAYKYKVLAQSQEQVPGYAVFNVESKKINLE